MNELWAVVMWDGEMEQWYHKIFCSKEAAHKGMLDWVRDDLEAMELDYAMRRNDEQEIEFVNDEAKILAVVKNNTAILTVGYREDNQYHMFRVN